MYEPEARESDDIAALASATCTRIAERARGDAIRCWTLEQLLPSPTIASKRWVYQQYDHTVRTEHRRRPGWRRGGRPHSRHRRRIALKTDCNGRYVYLDPREGGTDRRRRSGAQRGVHRRAGRWRSPTTSTSATRSAPRSTSSSAKRSPAWGKRAWRSARRSRAATSRSTTRIPSGAVYPTPVIGMVGLVDVARARHALDVPRRQATRSFCSATTPTSSAAASISRAFTTWSPARRRAAISRGSGR